MEAVFVILVMAFSVLIGGAFIGWLAMQVVGEKLAKLVATIFVVITLASEMGSLDTPAIIGAGLGLCSLLIALFRHEIQALRATFGQRHRS